MKVCVESKTMLSFNSPATQSPSFLPSLGTGQVMDSAIAKATPSSAGSLVSTLIEKKPRDSIEQTTSEKQHALGTNQEQQPCPKLAAKTSKVNENDGKGSQNGSKSEAVVRAQEHAARASQRYAVLKINHAQGATASVDVAVDKLTNQRVAIKRIFKRPTNARAIAREAAIHVKASQGHHSGVLCLLDVVDSGNVVKFITPFMSGGDLLDAIPPDSGLDLKRATRFSMQLFSALSHVHGLNIAHRDVKPENLMLTGDKHSLKLCDFGYAVNLNENELRGMHESVGTIPYLAPELFSADGQPSTAGKSIDWKACDVWSAGICVFAMITGRFPWGAAHLGSSEFSLFMKGTHSEDEKVRWQKIPAKHREMIYRLLAISPQDRPTAQEAYIAFRRMDFELTLAIAT